MTVCPRRSSRFRTEPFPWWELPKELQATVLLQLNDNDVTQLLLLLTRLARFLRPIRSVILEALRMDARLVELLDEHWCATALKCHQPTNQALTATFLGVHELDTHEPVEEVMAVELALVRPHKQPRHWKWRLRVRSYATGKPLDGDDEADLAFLEVWYTPGTRLGQLTAGTRERTHRFCVGKGRQLSAGAAELRANHICVCPHYGCPIWYPQLVTSRTRVLELRSFGSPLFRWQFPHELMCVMRFVSAFVK